MACVMMAFHSLVPGDKFLLMSAIQPAGKRKFENIYLFEKMDVNKGKSDIGHTESFEASRPVLKLP